jgi:hypothetical protein
MPITFGFNNSETLYSYQTRSLGTKSAMFSFVFSCKSWQLSSLIHYQTVWKRPISKEIVEQFSFTPEQHLSL